MTISTALRRVFLALLVLIISLSAFSQRRNKNSKEKDPEQLKIEVEYLFIEAEKLYLLKNYSQGDASKGLKYPSGSLCHCLYSAETVFRANTSEVCKAQVVEILTSKTLQTLDPSLFPTLQGQHLLETSYGPDNHYTTTIHLGWIE